MILLLAHPFLTDSIQSYSHCPALTHLNHLGAEGFHFRVCIEDKQVAGVKAPLFSWWDIQDENARLPVKEFSMSQIDSMFMPNNSSSSSGGSSSGSSSSDTATKAAKGALKGLGKAMNAMASAVEGGGGSHADHGPRVPIIAFKLLDLVKMHDDFALKHGGSKGHVPVATPRAAPKPRAAARPQQQQRQPAQRTPSASQQQQHAPRPTPQQQQQPPQRRGAPAQQRAAARPAAAAPANLMDFGASAASLSNGSGGYHRSSSMPAETRAEKLKREYAKKNQNNNRVWDDVDQRWVEVDPKAGVKAGSQSAPPQPARTSNAKKTVGVKLDGSGAVGKSANVQAAVNERMNDMKESQAKAVNEIRAREQKKKVEENAEDEVRKRLEPKIKVWSEEHGKKKQLRALLASLHTILWPGANWKQMGLGDLLDDSKVKRAFFKASRVVHPDKTTDLDAEKRFLAKRIFDALSQAKTVFDDGK